MSADLETPSPQPLTLAQLLERDLEGPLGTATEPDCLRYHSLYKEMCEKSTLDDDDVGTKVFALMLSACSLTFNLENRQEPFSNLWSFGNRRSALVDDFSDNEVELFNGIYPTCQNDELRARIADIVWIRKRDIGAARSAIKGYLSSAKLPRSFYHVSLERTHRAIQIAKSINDREIVDSVVSELATVLENADDNSLVSDGYHAMSMLVSERLGDPVLFASLCEKGARIEEGEHRRFQAHQWWLLKRDWLSLAGDKENARIAVVEAAENFVKEAEEHKVSGLIQSHHLQTAIELLRTIPGTKDRVQELHLLLNDAQKRSLGEMKRVDGPTTDLSGHILRARGAVSGKSFDDALKTLAFSVGFSNKDEVEQFAREQISKHPLMHMVSGISLSAKGKRVANRPSITGTSDEHREAIYAGMLQHVAMTRSFATAGFINPARQEILLDHRVTARSFLPLVTGSPFVPDDRRHIFAKGLYLGLVGESFASAHILVPQIENSLRHMLESRGEIVNSLNTDLVQDELSMNAILDHPKILEVLESEDILLCLREFFIEKQSANFRNELSHGLLTDEHLHCGENIYAWWLALFLCHAFKYTEITGESPSSENTAE